MINTSLDSTIFDAIVKSRQEFESNGKRDMEAALAESLNLFEKDIKKQEQQVIKTSNAQFEEE
jgi:hypothetical protein